MGLLPKTGLTPFWTSQLTPQSTSADKLYDANFNPIKGTPSTLTIAAGRASIYFQKITDADLTTPGFALKTLTAVTFSVMIGAKYLVTSGFAVAGLVSLF